ncbi:MAG: hypothetical protein JSU63_20645 [Phycisphaerales bacterium]|nr:MAG: hypothetical protein JSU63_20645 [Phycisphaerales bacterium]
MGIPGLMIRTLVHDNQQRKDRMGLFWDLIKQSQISDQRKIAGNLSTRVRRLEGELRRTQRTFHDLVVLLEKRFGEDIDADGKIG